MSDVVINTSRPVLDDSVFVAPTATVIGDVTLGQDVSIWYGACVRGDMAPIHIGDGSNVQENASIHVDPGVPVTIGRGVTIGHNAIVHGATIEDHALIGMGAIILNRAVIGAGSLIAAGTVVREGMVVPPGSLVAGVPGKILKALTAEQQAHMQENSALYVSCAKAHKLAQS
ncbi:MAG TPA: gamma carbonic anhydrase family protein [Armatimonadota bacterium]|jgi:carbonic anhydrase/acetyltransferase-like protein (isoleucine patch superfamily)